MDASAHKNTVWFPRAQLCSKAFKMEGDRQACQCLVHVALHAVLGLLERNLLDLLLMTAGLERRVLHYSISLR